MQAYFWPYVSSVISVMIQFVTLSLCVLCRTVLIGCWIVLWESGWFPDIAASQTLLCSNCYFGWFSLVCLLNWNLVFPFSSSPSSTGCTKDSVAHLPESLENWVLILSSIQIVSLCWALSPQNSWKEKWASCYWQPNEITHYHNDHLYCVVSGRIKKLTSLTSYYLDNRDLSWFFKTTEFCVSV